MRLPRVRFTVRRLMIAVAVVGISIGCAVGRRTAFLARAEGHRVRSGVFVYHNADGTSLWEIVGRDGSRISEARRSYHKDMLWKYQRAARYPWLPVWPDPPEPE
jgi:hypothetical protein